MSEKNEGWTTLNLGKIVQWEPTNSFRWLDYRFAKVLQQMWVSNNADQSASAYAIEWRDVPTVKEGEQG